MGHLRGKMLGAKRKNCTGWNKMKARVPRGVFSICVSNISIRANEKE